MFLSHSFSLSSPFSKNKYIKSFLKSLFSFPLLSGIEKLHRKFRLVSENIYAEKWVKYFLLLHLISTSLSQNNRLPLRSSEPGCSPARVRFRPGVWGLPPRESCLRAQVESETSSSLPWHLSPPVPHQHSATVGAKLLWKAMETQVGGWW